jgi:hypothetical protein
MTYVDPQELVKVVMLAPGQAKPAVVGAEGLVDTVGAGLVWVVVES